MFLSPALLRRRGLDADTERHNQPARPAVFR
jgi:hypothetical protein